MRRVITAAVFLVALSVAVPARAADFVWSFTSGGLGASAVFHDLGGGQLQITLTNTGTGDVVDPAQVLSALLFNCSCGSLTPVSATTSGQVVLNGNPVAGQGPGTVVGGEWAFGASQTQGGQPTLAITSMGAFNGIGQPNFPGTNLQDPAALDGIEYGIVPSTENGVGNGGIITQNLIQHDVVFVLGGFNGNMNFTNVSFQYGTSLTEPNFGGGTGTGGGSTQTLVPEPTSLLLFGSGLAMTAYRARRRKQQKNN